MTVMFSAEVSEAQLLDLLARDLPGVLGPAVRPAAALGVGGFYATLDLSAATAGRVARVTSWGRTRFQALARAYVCALDYWAFGA